MKVIIVIKHSNFMAYKTKIPHSNQNEKFDIDLLLPCFV